MFGRRAVLAVGAALVAGLYPGGARALRALAPVPLNGLALGIGPLVVAELQKFPQLTVDRLHGRLAARYAGRFLGWLPPAAGVRPGDRVRVAAAHVDARGMLHVSVCVERDRV